MKRRDFIWKTAGLAGLATAGCTDSKLDIFIPKQSLDDYLQRYTPIVEDIYNNNQTPSQFLYTSMLSDGQGISMDYNRNDGAKVEYSGPRLASEPIKGDLDNNSKTDIFDLLKLLNILSGREQATPVADIDGNGIVNIFDLLDLLKILSGTYGKTFFKGKLTDLFSDGLIPEADIEVLDVYGKPVSTQKAKNGSYNVSLASSDDYYRLRFTAQNFFQHISSLLKANQSITKDIGLVPSSFNMDLFDSIVRSGVNQPSATTRWMTVPNFYIVNGPISGYTGFEAPSVEMVNELVEIINKDLKQFTNGFVNNPVIKIGNDPLGEGAVEYVRDYGMRPNEGWITIDYTLDPSMGFIGERSVVTNPDYSVQRAKIRIHGPPVWGDNNRGTGMHELTAVMSDLKNTREDIESVLSTNYDYQKRHSTFDLQMGKFLYSRPAGNRTPDINP